LEQLVHGIQDGVGAVMAQAMASLGGQVRTLMEKQAENAAAGPTTADLEQLAHGIQDGVGAVMAQAMASLGTEVRTLVEKQAENAAAGPTAADLEQLAHGIQDGVGAVMAQAMASLGTEMRSIASQQAEGDDEPKGPTPAEIAEAMRLTLGPALESSISNLGRELRDALAAQQASLPEPPAPPDWGHIAGTIQESVGSAVEDAMAAMAVQMKSVLVQKDARDTEEQRRDIALLAERLRETMAEAISGMREAQQSAIVETVSGLHETQNLQQGELARIAETALQSIAAESKAAREAQQVELARLAEMTLQSIVNARETQGTQQSQLAQIAEASMQSVRQTTELIEKHIVNESNRRDLMRGRRAKHASVAPFGGVSPETPPTAEALEADSKLMDALDSETPLESLTFANFFPGTMNEFTHKVCQAVAAAPGGEYNPLFLYGHVGIGKTHLVSAIGNAILTGGGKKKAAPLRVGYVSSSHFSRRLAEAILENAQDAFRENYCHWDVLILDDIQFLGGRVEAQEEFFHIFNALHQQGRQIIIVADKAPDRLGLLEQRLVSRFASGIVAELKAPEWDTRMQILRHRVEQSGVAVPEEILSLIAMRVPGDVRKMTGALRKVAAFAKLIGKSITVEMAQEILSHLGVDEAA
jgi:chromosomal replication initiator protein DnaA